MIKRRESRVSPEIPTASMADIAFLLIVFFLVTTTMNQDKGLSLHLPPVGETKEVQSKNILNVWINARDQLAFFENDQLTPIPSGQLQSQLKACPDKSNHSDSDSGGPSLTSTSALPAHGPRLTSAPLNAPTASMRVT